MQSQAATSVLRLTPCLFLYIERFLEAVRAADWSDADEAKQRVVGAMSDYLEAEELRS